jgi:salicylate hydroxylase
MEQTYGCPYFLIHRGDLHKVLLNRALDVGVQILTNSFVSTVIESDPSITLADGSVHKADLIIGADGNDSRPAFADVPN